MVSHCVAELFVSISIHLKLAQFPSSNDDENMFI